MRSVLPRFTGTKVAASAAVVLGVSVLAACTSSSTSSGTTSASNSNTPILIGASLSLDGSPNDTFQTDGLAFQKGYELWAKDVNEHGGLLGRKVVLKILDDGSSPNQVVTNYQTLFGKDHVALAFGPFSSLLSGPASAVAARYDMAFVEGAGGAPSVFDTTSNQADHDTFDVSLPIADEMVPLYNWIKSLPPSERPKTAAYPMAQDPFADPPVELAQTLLSSIGVHTVYSNIFTETESAYKAPAQAVAASGAQLVVLGSTDVPTVQTFMQVFQQEHYTPKLFIAASGPDQGAAFVTAVGQGNENGMMVPNGWYPGIRQPGEPADGPGVRQTVRRHRVRHQRRRGGGLLGGPDHGAGGHRHPRHQQREDHRLPAQRRHAEQRPGSGEVRRAGRERSRGGVRLPVAAG